MANVQNAAAAEGNTRMEIQYISSNYTIIIPNRLASGDSGDTIASIGWLVFFIHHYFLYK